MFNDKYIKKNKIEYNIQLAREKKGIWKLKTLKSWRASVKKKSAIKIKPSFVTHFVEWSI